MSVCVVMMVIKKIKKKRSRRMMLAMIKRYVSEKVSGNTCDAYIVYGGEGNMVIQSTQKGVNTGRLERARRDREKD